MDSDTAVVFVTVIGGLVILILAYFWSTTTRTVKTIETETIKSTNLVTESTKEKIAQMELEGKKLEIASTNQKNAYDHENNKDKLKVELNLHESLLEREKLIQSGKTTRVSIQSDAILSLTKLNNEVQKLRIEADLSHTDKLFEFKHKQLTSGIELERFKAKKNLESTKLQLEQRKFETLSGLEALNIVETGKDRRLQTSLNSALKLQRESLESLRDREQKRLEFDERKFTKQIDFKLQREQQKTARIRIKGETDIIKGCLLAGNLAASQMTGIIGSVLGNAAASNSLSSSSPSVCTVEEIDDDNDQVLTCLK